MSYLDEASAVPSAAPLKPSPETPETRWAAYLENKAKIERCDLEIDALKRQRASDRHRHLALEDRVRHLEDQVTITRFEAQVQAEAAAPHPLEADFRYEGLASRWGLRIAT